MSAFTLSTLIRADSTWHESCLDRVGQVTEEQEDIAMTTKGLNASQTGRTSFLGSRDRFGSPRRCRGFKLVEFVVVLAIASTLGITAVSASYGSSSGSRQGPRVNAQIALAEIAAQETERFA